MFSCVTTRSIVDLTASMDLDKVGEVTMVMDQLDLAATVDHMDPMASMDMTNVGEATVDMDQLDLGATVDHMDLMASMDMTKVGEATVDHDHTDVNWSDWTGHIWELLRKMHYFY